ncbi:tripartite tricarboxylate transporter substrate-binding protein [Rhodoplanes sp. Z2-YC6860]|uniref:tripartite tricarboxylate transporter substrate-binding protein n=1 Tax=Rhodoplanes sp. Z2-YC6860 TaxID=674703 RepID=UPI00078DFA15|nr:tripartite tricarboxylate transporter substrate-binding protein [Rhodoplanes sp. Z2-YC6860]AMN44853.1 tricarboxylate binding receptor [Rhodoplanes sp. Z2-YC6860]
MLTRRKLLAGLSSTLVSVRTVAAASAAAYPTRPITVIVPFPAGGPTDIIARVVSEKMSAHLAQPIIVENITGAAGTIGAGRVAHAVPDGYTLCVGFLGTHVLNGAVYKLDYDIVKDFEPIALLASNPQLIVARKDLLARDLKELIAWLKANPGKATQGSAGIGSPAHVSGAYFQQASGTTFQFAQYRGAAPAMQDLVGGHVDLMFDQPPNSLPNVRAGSIKALAVTAKARLPSAPDIPTVDEAGLPGFYISVWSGMWAPKGTPREIVSTLNRAVADALGHESVQSRLADLGQEVPPRDQQTAAALARYQAAEVDKWWPIVKSMNLKLE